MKLTFRMFAYPVLVIGAAVGLIMYRGMTGIPGRPPAHYFVDRTLASAVFVLGMTLGFYLFSLVDIRKKRSRLMGSLLAAGHGVFLGVLFSYAYIVFGREVSFFGGVTAVVYAITSFHLLWKIVNRWALSEAGKTELVSLQTMCWGMTTLIVYLFDGFYPPVIWIIGGA